MSISSTELREKKPAPAPQTKKYLWIAVAALVVGVVVYAAFAGSGRDANTPPKERVTSAKEALGRLYAEAQKDLKKKRLSAAAVKFKQLANMDADYKDAAEQAEAAAAKLVDEAVQDIKNGDYDAAKKKLDTAKKVDPKNKKIDEKLNEIEDKTGGEIPAPGENTEPPAGGGLREIPADATPKSLLIDEISGYEAIANGWIQEPFKAGSSFLPTSNEVRAEIDRVLLTIVKFDTDQDADEKLAMTKQSWPLDAQDITINGHDAYAGIYNFANERDYYRLRQMATISWTRDTWFFTVEVLPRGTPDSTYKKAIARDVAIQLGY